MSWTKLLRPKQHVCTLPLLGSNLGHQATPGDEWQCEGCGKIWTLTLSGSDERPYEFVATGESTRFVQPPTYRKPVDVGDGTTETMYPDACDPKCLVGVLDYDDGGVVIHAHHRGVHVGTLLTSNDARLFAEEVLRRAGWSKAEQ